ncbi:MAG: hypothetical protein J6A99_00275 [Clostridia bacterium]|nr:hypothetical protein [Clostridia bacterium]
MDKAIWNGQIYTAFNVSKSYETEKNIRKASGYKELRCPDPCCPNPIVKYCHGEIKSAYFAHINNCYCDYALFDKEITQEMREIKNKLYKSFVSKGFDVEQDVKVFSGHYTHFLFNLPNDRKVAIELGTQKITANQIDYLSLQYQKIGIKVKWIVISDSIELLDESNLIFIKRYSLNENKMRDVLIIDSEGVGITQQVIDPNKYEFEGRTIVSKNYPSIFTETNSLEYLAFENEELTIEGFYDRYNKWLNKKMRAFENKKVELEKEKIKYLEMQNQKKALIEQRRKEREDVLKKEKQQQQNCSNSRFMTYEERRNSIMPLMNQVEKQVIDELGERWIRCKVCGIIETVDKFLTYGGKNHSTLGVCRACHYRINGGN